MQFFILQEMRDNLHFVCAILGFVCKVLKKRGKVFFLKQKKKVSVNAIGVSLRERGGDYVPFMSVDIG